MENKVVNCYVVINVFAVFELYTAVVTAPEAFIFKFITKFNRYFMEIVVTEVYISINKFILSFINKKFVFRIPIICFVCIIKRIFVFSASDIY